MKAFRKLKAEEIDVRLQSIQDTFAIFLLYKDARVDYNLLDETYGEMGWQAKYTLIDGVLYCSIGVFDENSNQWIWKENCGVESNTEAEKGRASDALKRAGFCWGIGRELYSSPVIKIWKSNYPSLNKFTKLHVEEIEYDENENISKLSLFDDKGNQAFYWDKKTQKKPKFEPKKSVEVTPEVAKEEQETPKVVYATAEQVKFIYGLMNVSDPNDPLKQWLKKTYNTTAVTDLTAEQAQKIIDSYKHHKEKK